MLFLILTPKFQQHSSNNKKENKEEIIKNKGIVAKILKIFNDPLQTFHHILLIIIYISALYSTDKRIFIWFVFLDEISVPFLLIKKQMQRLDLQKKRLFAIIELIFIVFYLISRGVLLPFLDFIFRKQSKNGFLLISCMNWLNYFWIMQILCLFMKIMKEKEIKKFDFMRRFLDDYRNNKVSKWIFHGFLLFPLIFLPNILSF